MSAAAAPDRERLVRVIADRHGIRVDKDDPLFAVGTICEAHMDEAARRFDELITQRITDFEAAVGKVQRRAGHLIAEEFNDHLLAVRNSLQTDITLAGAKANDIVFRIEQAYRYPVVIRWTVVGMLSAVLFVALGVWIGRYCVRQ
jgi:hypothetical protein